MPFTSKSQQRKFGALLSQGKISQATFDKWTKETKKPWSKLPEKAKQKTSKK